MTPGQPTISFMTFAGFPSAAFDFYDDLEIDNSKAFWQAHNQTYQQAVKQPMLALLAVLEPRFGPAKMFRPHRDVRFAKDKSPYKTHQGAFVPAGPATGWYLELAASGFRVGAGFYDSSTARLAAIRQAIDAPTGAELEKIIRRLTRSGWDMRGDTVKTSPRGFDADHPRIDLLRHKTLSVGRGYDFADVIDNPNLGQRIATDWRAVTPLVDWLVAHPAEV